MGVRSWWKGETTQPYMRPTRSRSSQMAHKTVDGTISTWPYIFGGVVFVAALVTIIAFLRGSL